MAARCGLHGGLSNYNIIVQVPRHLPETSGFDEPQLCRRPSQPDSSQQHHGDMALERASKSEKTKIEMLF